MTMLERAAYIANQLTQQQQNGQPQFDPNNLNPFMRSGYNAIINGDNQQGEAIANKILNQVGISREQAMQIAHQRGLI